MYWLYLYLYLDNKLKLLFLSKGIIKYHIHLFLAVATQSLCHISNLCRRRFQTTFTKSVACIVFTRSLQTLCQFILGTHVQN